MPNYRNEIKGNVSAVKQDVVQSYRGEMNHSECFPSDDFREYDTYEEYNKYFTDEELEKLFKKALKVAPELHFE